MDTPLVLTSHVEPAPEVVRSLADRPEVSVVAVSEHQATQMPGVADVTVIRHGIDVRAFPFAPEAGGYLLFLGRMIPDKGPAEAIRLAQAADMPLVLAGGAEDGYDITAEPAVDGERIRYAGRVGAPLTPMPYHPPPARRCGRASSAPRSSGTTSSSTARPRPWCSPPCTPSPSGWS